MKELGVNERDEERAESPLVRAARESSLSKKLKKYLRECRPPPDADPKKESGRLPNLAGFCASLGCGVRDTEVLRREYPAAHDYLLAVMEDEALNSNRSTTLLNTYLKERFGYGEKQEDTPSMLQPVFEHDILEDGE